MYLQIKDDNLSAEMFLGKCHPDLLFILIEMEIYSLLQLKFRKKSSWMLISEQLYILLFAVEFYGDINSFFKNPFPFLFCTLS